MLPIQDFCIDNIYCSPSQDKQFNFSLVRVNNEKIPVKSSVTVYHSKIQLPDNENQYHVFIIGNINPNFINFLKQDREWFKDVWVNLGSDMKDRNYIGKVYNQDGLIFPRENTYYNFIDDNSLLIAIKFDYFLKFKFAVESFKYLHVYSNSYFNTSEYNSLPTKLGIEYDYLVVTNNVDKVTLQTKITNYESNGGKVLIYVNGFVVNTLSLTIPDYSIIELVYDQSIISRESYSISSLRTFDSTKDNKMKYLLFRDSIVDHIQFYDDNEIYITNSNNNLIKGTYFYQHKDFVVRNVTDKDYSLYTTYVNNQATALCDLLGGSINDKNVVIYTRKSGLIRNIVYSNLKLHELYKLPSADQLNVLLGTNFVLTELRAETLENSDYFKIVSETTLPNLTKEICSSVVGYNAISYYYGFNPIRKIQGNNSIDVPFIFHKPSIAFEYDITGKYIGNYTTTGSVYLLNNINAEYVEFLYGFSPDVYSGYYQATDTITLKQGEYRVISALFGGFNRFSIWEDITNTNKVIVNNNNTITINESTNKLVKVIYLNEVSLIDYQIPLSSGVIYFPLSIYEDRGTGLQNWPIDIPYANIEVYLNGNRLTYGLDFFISFPNIGICNKTYLDYTKTEQDIHVRLHGFNLDPEKINSTEINGFVNHGVLARNNVYDIRDDRVFSTFIDGKLYRREDIIYAENDNVVRLNNPLNGLPYTIRESFIPIKDVTNTDSYALYLASKAIDKKISNFFDLALPEPNINETNIISNNHFVYSLVVSKVINDLLDGNIEPSIYTNAYNDSTIINLLDSSYKTIYSLDPVKYNLPENVQIHPHLGNTVIDVNLYIYRFIVNIVRIITNNKPEKINLSGYLRITT